MKTALLNLACIFSFKGSCSTGQLSELDSSLPLANGASAGSAEPVGATFHHGEQGEIQQHYSQGENREQRI